MDNTQEYTCLSLCSGYGGLELGLKRALPNVRTVAYVEVEAFACANLVAKMETGLLDAAPIWTDIKTFDAEPFRDRVHFITAGYPCQGESHAGKRQGAADPRWLWPHIEGIIETVQPVWFFGENVRGHLSLGYPAVYRSLRNMGYKVESGLFTAAEVGASIAGERLFILAEANGVRELQQERIKQNQWGRSDNGNSQEVAATESARHKTSEQGGIITPRPRPANSSSYIRGVALQGEEQHDWEEPREIKPELDGTIIGFASWSHRLRLLGNGVIPQQAEKAFRELMKLF